MSKPGRGSAGSIRRSAVVSSLALIGALCVMLSARSAQASLASTEVPADSNSSGALSTLFELQLTAGVGSLMTSNTNAAFAYSNGGSDTQLQVRFKSARLAALGTLTVFLNSELLSLQRFRFSPYLSMSGLFGSLGAYKVMPGVRFAYWGKVVRPWVAVGVGYGEISGSVATVHSGDGSSDDGLTAPDGSHIAAGETIHASLGSLGADAHVGVNITLGESWNLVASVGYGAFKSLGDWEAKAQNDADEEVSLGKLPGLSRASLSGLSATVGVSCNF